MSLGERIYRLRSEKNLSQGDLADALNVSRQSISKWETNSSVPELDKLIKLSEIFGVTLDELVLDKHPKTPEQPVPTVRTVYVERQSSGRKTAGTILCCFSALVWLLVTVLGEVLVGLVLALPFLACGLICLLVRKRPGLWCAWTVYLVIDIYLRVATGVSWKFAFWGLFLAGDWTVHLIVSWCQVLVLAALIGATLRSFRKEPVQISKKKVALLAAGWLVYLLSFLPWHGPVTNSAAVAASRLLGIVDWLWSILLVVLLIASIRMLETFLKNRRQTPAA